MSFSISWHRKAQKYLDSLSKDLTMRIIDKLELVATNPFRFLQHYGGKYYKLRIGDYRALLEVDFDNKIILVMVLDKRGRIYKDN